MKILFVAVAIAVLVYVSAEPCPGGSNAECVNHGITKCDGSYHVVCHNNICECLQTDVGSGCRLASDCPDCDNGRHKHCVDGRCRCTRF